MNLLKTWNLLHRIVAMPVRVEQRATIAIIWELLMLALILYVPILERTFGTYGLPLRDWLIIVAAALTISPVLELAKWMERRGWFGQLQ